MAVVIDGKVYVNGEYIGEISTSDKVVNIEYDRPRVYVVS